MKFALTWVLAPFAALALIGIAYAATPEPTPKPAALSFVKTGTLAAPADGIVGFEIRVENSGGTDSRVHVQDQLPGGTLWAISGNTMGCDLNGELGAQYLDCSDTVEARHLNESKDDFENGRAVVSVWGLANGCGQSYRNQASMVADGVPSASNVAYATTAVCPTPVPTNTPEPTSTPIPTVTAAATTAVPATATPIRVVPLPPNTGNSQPSDRGTALWASLAGAVTAGIAATFIVRAFVRGKAKS